MDYLSNVRVLDTDYKIKDEEAARINHTHKVEEIEGAAKEGHQHQASEIDGLSAVATSGSYSDLSGKPSAATESADGLMSAADKAKLDGIQAGAGSCTHPTHTAHASGLYKVAVDSLGHVSSATAATKSDITALGIPAQDTDTTYTEATASKAGLMSASDKKKLDNKVDDTAEGVSASLEKLPQWTAIPTDSTQLVRRDTNGTAEYGRVTFRTAWSYIRGKADAVYAAMSHTHSASQVSGLARVAASGKYADLSGAPSSMKNPAALTVQANGETVAAYDGSSAATANITPANIGAAPSSHTHPYLPLSGGTLTGNVAAPKFVGGLQGTADAAKKADRATIASRVADNGAGTANVARHVWFSDSGIETARVCNDAFRYNPVGNMPSCNVSGNASTASKLSTARTINLTGAVSGSAKFDGSGNVGISTTANESCISSPISGLYSMAADEDGNLWAYHSDSDKIPEFQYDSETGNLYYVAEA